MIRRILMLLLALSLFGAVECQGASDSKSKKSAKVSKKAKRQQKGQRKKLMRSAVMLRQEFKKIHSMQKELTRLTKNPERAKELTDMINASMKKLAPHVKAAGNIAGASCMADIPKLVAEGKKLASEPEKYPDSSMLELLQEHQLQQIEAFRKKVSE